MWLGEQFTRICAASRSKECVPPLLAWPFTSCSGTITNDVTDIPNDQCSRSAAGQKRSVMNGLGNPLPPTYIFHMRNFAASVRHQRQSMWQALQIADQEMRRYFLMVLIRNNRTVASSHLPSGLAIWNQGVDATPHSPPTAQRRTERSFLTKAAFDICNLRLIGHGEGISVSGHT